MRVNLRLRATGMCLLALLLAPDGLADSRGPSYQAFESLFARVTQAVERGDLSRETGEQARDLWVATRKDLIQADAAIDMAIVEIRSYQDARQEKALEDLVRAVATRERLLAARIRGLEELAGLRAEIPDSASAPCVAVTPVEQKPLPAPPPQEKKLSWEPEDLTKSPKHP